MEKSTTLLGKYNNLEKESEALLVDFLKKCPNNSWNIDLRLGIQSGHIGTCERMFLSPIQQTLCFYFKDYKDCNGNCIIEASKLMYGEMAQIIGILPNEVGIERYHKLQGFLIPNYSIEGLLSEHPFYDNVAFGKVQITDVEKVEGNSVHLKGLQNDGEKIRLHYSLEDGVVEDLIAHLEKSVMLCSKQYKIIKFYLGLQENLNLDINGEVTIECNGLTLNVVSIDTTDREDFITIHGAVADDERSYIHIDAFTLRPQDLDEIVNYIFKRLIDINGYIVSCNLQKVFSNSTALTIYDAIIDEVINEAIEEMLMSRGWNVQKALEKVILKRMGLASAE